MRRIRIFGSLAVLALTVAGCQPTEPRGFRVRVDRVVSGQTVEISPLEGNPPTSGTLRFIGLDAPDLQQQPWGVAAKNRLQALVEGREAIVEFDVESRDGFDRYLGYLWIDGVLVNEQLIAEGYVLDSTRSPNIKYQQQLTLARERARLTQQGIWNPDNPLRQTPGEFRRHNR